MDCPRKWLTFKKCMNMYYILYRVIELIMYEKGWFCGPDKGEFYSYTHAT